MKIAMMQPTFLPWQGFFELIVQCDRFIFLDDFQLSVQSHHTRNKLFISHKVVDFYSVPIQKSKCFGLPLNNVLIIEGDIWKKKILKRLANVYSKTDFFSLIYPQLENWFSKNYSNLAELNIEGIKLICKILGIMDADFCYSSQCNTEDYLYSSRSNKVISLLKWAEGTEYLCAFGAYDYMAEDNVFPVDNVKVKFQHFIPKCYYQKQSEEFIPYLSVLDALFNIGPEKTLELIKNGTEKWLIWEERKIYGQQ
ncbi:MAG: WbqC family protein [Alphaproteobacteria bacterium]|nr:WbqC family protein [Alphaproteobacteria bacterium]